MPLKLHSTQPNHRIAGKSELEALRRPPPGNRNIKPCPPAGPRTVHLTSYSVAGVHQQPCSPARPAPQRSLLPRCPDATAPTPRMTKNYGPQRGPGREQLGCETTRMRYRSPDLCRKSDLLQENDPTPPQPHDGPVSDRPLPHKPNRRREIGLSTAVQPSAARVIHPRFMPRASHPRPPGSRPPARRDQLAAR